MPFKKHFDISIRLSLFLIFIIPLGLFCANCSLETSQSERPSLNHDDTDNDKSPDDHVGGSEPSDSDSNSDEDENSDGNRFNPSDFSWEDVHFLNGGVVVRQDISGWSETSRITNFFLSSKGVSQLSRGVCIDHTMRNIWLTTVHPEYADEPWEKQGSGWIFIPHNDGNIYATLYENLSLRYNPTKGKYVGSTCELAYHGDITFPELISEIVDKVKVVWLTGKAERDAVAPVQDWYPQPGDILGFAVSTWARGPASDYRSGSLNERSDIVWVRLPDYNTVDEGGEIVGRSSDSTTTTTTTITTTTTTSTTTTTTTTTTTITTSTTTTTTIPTSSTSTSTTQTSNSVVCSQKAPHYKEVNGQCLPSCGNAANLAGYGGYGPDDQMGTSDDSHTYVRTVSSCSDLQALGHSDWKNFIFQDEVSLTPRNNSQIYEVAAFGGVCCVRGDNPGPGTTTSTSTTTSRPRPSCRIPNKYNVIKRVATEYARALQDSDCGNRYRNTTWEFLDRVVKRLHASDRRWGYNCNRGNCKQLSKDAIAYYCGKGAPNSKSTSVGIVDIITKKANNCQHQWVDITQKTKDNNTVGRWNYPRPGSPITDPVVLTQRSDNPPNMLHVVKRVANSHRQVLLNSCRRGHENLDFLDLVLTELRKENEGARWGFNCKRGDCNHLSIDAIAYYRGTGSNLNNSTDVAIFDIIASCHSDSPRPAWQDMTQATKDNGTIGRYKYPR